MITLVFFASCKNDRETNLSGNSVYQPEQLYLNDTVIQFLDDYLMFTNGQKTKDFVYQLFIDQGPDSVSLYLTFSQYHEQLLILNPSGYVIYRGKLFVLYSGLSPFLRKDTDFLKKLQKEIDKYELKTRGQGPSLIEYDAWTLVFYDGIDTFTIRKRNYNPYGNIGIFR